MYRSSWPVFLLMVLNMFLLNTTFLTTSFKCLAITNFHLLSKCHIFSRYTFRTLMMFAIIQNLNITNRQIVREHVPLNLLFGQKKLEFYPNHWPGKTSIQNSQTFLKTKYTSHHINFKLYRKKYSILKIGREEKNFI